MLFAKGKLNEEIFDELTQPLNEEREALEAQLQALTIPREALLEKIQEINEAIHRINAEVIKDHYTHKEILADISKITILPDNKITISFKVGNEADMMKLDYFNITIAYE